jgi:hypothetical protein
MSKHSSRVFSPPLPKTAPQPPGLYRRYFTPVERTLLDAVWPDDASSELDLLRSLLSRTLAAARGTPRPGLPAQGAILSTFAAAAIVLAGLARFQARFAPLPPDPFLDALDALDPDDL